MITTVTLNASIDKAYYMEQEIRNGTVMRVSRCRNSAGGKGLNVSRVLALCGSEVKATGLVGGYNGSYLEHLLSEDGIAHEFWHIAGETRSCINILDPVYGSTEYLEPGCTVTEEEYRGFLEKLPEIAQSSSVVTLSGSAPRGLPNDVYGQLVRRLKQEGKTVLLDTSGDLLAQALPARPDFIKPNRDELEALFGTSISSMDDVVACARKLYAQGIPMVVVSLGKDGALMLCKEGVFRAISPDVPVVNTVGCGDSMVAGFAAALERGEAPAEALRYASAVASANALSPNTGDFDPAVMKQLYEDTVVEKLD